jgi:phosphoglycolate phosphatase
MKTAAELLASADAVLLDFDGPICSVFAGVEARVASQRATEALRCEGHVIPPRWSHARDPHELLRQLADLLPPAAVVTADRAIAAVETEAILSATTTAGLHDLLSAIGARPWAIVSNNSSNCIRRWISDRDLSPPPSAVVARVTGRPQLMKPNPYVLSAALASLGVPATSAVLVGDSVSDIEAARAAGVPAVGYANKRGKRQRLIIAGADAIIENLADLLV